MVANNCTIAGNTSPLGSGGGIDNSLAGASAKLGNTIIAGNTALAAPDFSGTLNNDLGNNLLQNSAGSGGFTGPGDLQDVNPLLSPQGNYSGPTQTFGLLPGSPAIDAGNNALIPGGITTDQRGLARIVHTTVDIGAFESSGFTLGVSSGSPQSTGINTAFAPLVVSVGSTNNEPVQGGVVTFTAPTGGASCDFPPGSNDSASVSSGLASIVGTANGVLGAYSVQADSSRQFFWQPRRLCPDESARYDHGGYRGAYLTNNVRHFRHVHGHRHNSSGVGVPTDRQRRVLRRRRPRIGAPIVIADG